jgi:hypothetical protein
MSDNTIDVNGVETLVYEPMLDYKVTNNKDGEFEMAVKVLRFSEDADGNLYPSGTVNTWNLGFNEEIAKTKVKTIVDTYLKGLEFIQSEVRKVFEEA